MPGACLNVLTVLYLTILLGLGYLQACSLLWLNVPAVYPISLYSFLTMLYAVENYLLLQDLKKKQEHPQAQGQSPREDQSLINTIITQNFKLRLENRRLTLKPQEVATGEDLCGACTQTFLRKARSTEQFRTRALQRRSSHDAHEMTAL